MMSRLSNLRSSCLAFASLATGFVPGPAAAERALVVDPPPGHTVATGQPDPGYSENLEIASTLDPDAGCQAAFQPVAATGASQAQLNEIAATPAYVTTVKAFLGLRFAIDKVAPYRLDGILGVHVEGDAKGGAGVRAFATILETPKGRTTIVCIGPSARTGELRGEFEAITRGVVPPR